MDSQIAQQHHFEGDQVEEQPHEKKSVLKKVKAKAKKIKDTLTKHGHGHDDHDDVPDDHDLDEEDDYEEESVEDPDIHDAPMYESSKIKSSSGGGQPESTFMPPGLNYDRPTPMSVDPPAMKEGTRGTSGKTSAIVGEGLHTPQNTPVDFHATRGGTQNRGETDPVKPLAYTQGGDRPRVDLDRPITLEEDPHGPNARSPSNYQTKVTDPTGIGGEEAGVTPIIQSLDKMNIFSESETGQEHSLSRTEPDKSASTKVHDEILHTPTGSHDQFSPEQTPPTPITSSTESPKETANPSSYSDKISFATSAIAEKAVAAKNIMASKLGYGERDNKTMAETHQEETTSAKAEEPPVGYGQKIASAVTDKLTPVYEKVSGAGSTAVSKIRGTSTNNTAEEGSEIKDQDKGVSVKEYLSEKLKPGEEDRALSGVISDALHKRKGEEDTSISKPVGVVTESEQVKRHLGQEDERVDSPVKAGVVDKLKGAVGSLFGKEDKSHTTQTQPPYGSETVTEEVEHDSSLQGGERRLQESTN
ncbi:low-temperature-induced 65 kDa protein-like [Rutidosis leptorrhynchoides]|uniref:low-temperature-induced 65 kDa protein-like n=1 Tax=Rutidosis leptorrhynchoides TaxID=125765 RepID=UPI003A997D10